MNLKLTLFFTGLFYFFGLSATYSQTPKYLVGAGEYDCFILNTSTHQAYDVKYANVQQVTGPSSIVQISAALHHYALVDGNGNVWSWGENQYANVGIGTQTTSVANPTQIMTDSSGNAFTNVVQVVATTNNNGYETMALKADGTVWIWGNTQGGIRGNGSAGGTNSRPVQVTFPSGTVITKIAAGMIGIALDNQGNVWTWGGWGYYPSPWLLARGSNPSAYLPAKINLPSKAADIAGGNLWSYALLSNGSLYGWGCYTSYLGIGNSGYMSQAPASYTPTLLDGQLGFPAKVAKIAVNCEASYAILTDSTLWAWGDNAVGAIGNGQELNFATYTVNPAPTGGTPTPYAWDWGVGENLQQKPVHIANGLHSFTNIFGGTGDVFYAYAEDSHGQLYSWGRNKGDVCGNGIFEGDISGLIESNYPNSYDVPWITAVDPLNQKLHSTSSPFCVSNGSSSYCLNLPIPITAPPTVNPGPTQNITTSTTTLTGTATGNGGSLINYTLWTQVSGPTTALITIPSGLTATISNLTTGTYVFQLRAIDNNWRKDSAKITVNVNLGAKSSPKATAGTDPAITLPLDSVALSGSGSDPNSGGTITAYQWSVASGPSTYGFSTTTNAATEFRNLVQGTYKVVLKVTDNFGLTGTDTVLVIVNAASTAAVPPVTKPLVIAADPVDTTVHLPTSSVSLSAAGSSDPNGAKLAYQWSVLSGPSGYSLSGAATSLATLSDLAAGTYKVTLNISDSLKLSKADTLTINVTAAGYSAPTVYAGANQTITLPTDSVALSGSASDLNSGGSISSYSWTMIGAPADSYSFSSRTTAKTELRGLTNGTYTVVLKATDNYGLSTSDTMTVIVKQGKPIVNAGPDQTIQLPLDSVTLSGSATDYNLGGQISSYSWVMVGAPGSDKYSFSSRTSAKTELKVAMAGTYTAVLTAIDNMGYNASDTVVITVKPQVFTALKVSAGSNETIQLPLDSVALKGSASDPNSGGEITSYSWVMIGAPGSDKYSFSTRTVASTELKTLAAGVYTALLTVKDNFGLSASDSVVITVDAASSTSTGTSTTGSSSNITPLTVSAGGNQTIILPVDSTSMIANTSADAGDSIISYQWSYISGPTQYAMRNPDASRAEAYNLTVGTYTFALTVTDNSGRNASDTVVVTVDASIQSPKAVIANTDTVVSLTDSLTANGYALVGSESLAPTGGSLTSYVWLELAGPSEVTLSAADSANTNINGLALGNYLFQLTVTDNLGRTSTAVMGLDVEKALPTPPAMQEAAMSARVFPNPVSSTLNVNLNGYSGNIAFRIYNAGGTLVQATSIEMGADEKTRITPMNISKLPTGMYFLQVEGNGSKKALTFLKAN